MTRILILTLIILMLVACGGEPTPTPKRVYPQIALATATHTTVTTESPTKTSLPKPSTEAPAETGTHELPTEAPQYTGSGRIAYQSWLDGDWDICVMNANGSGQTRLTDNPVEDFHPAWSPDGTRIAFVSSRDGNREIYVMNSDGSGQTRLTNNPADDGGPAWSPDGARIAFVSSRDEPDPKNCDPYNWEIYVMHADGSERTCLTNNPAVDISPAWSPDGTRIAFVSGRDGNGEIYVMHADGSEQTRLTNNPADDTEPAWSPDGTRIAFVSDRNDEGGIYVMSADGTEQTRLTSNPTAGEPAWSPDGTRIAFTSFTLDGFEIFVMNADGSKQINLTQNLVPDGCPAWSPTALTATPSATLAPQPGTSAPTEPDLLDEIRRTGMLVVSTDENFAPQSWRNEAHELVGFDVEAAKEVAKRLGVELRFETPEWSSVTQGFWGVQWDVSIGSMTPTEQRAEVLWFTEPYHYVPACFAVHKNNTDIMTPDDLSGKKVGLGTATTYEHYLNGVLEMLSGEIAYDPPKVGEVRAYRTDQEAILDLAQGDGVRLDAVMSAQQMIRGAIEEGIPLREVIPPAFYEGLVFALDKNRGPSERMIAELNRIISEMRADGTLSRLSREWLGADYSIPGATIPTPTPPRAPPPTKQP